MTVLTTCFACSLLLIDFLIPFFDTKFSRSSKLPLPSLRKGGSRGSRHQVSACQAETKIAPGWRASVWHAEGEPLSFQWKYSWNLVLLKVLGHWKQLHGCYCKNNEHLWSRTSCIYLGETNTPPRRASSKTHPLFVDGPYGCAWRQANLTGVLWPPGLLPLVAPCLSSRPHLGTTVYTVSLISFETPSWHHHPATPSGLVASEGVYGWDQPIVGIWDCCTGSSLPVNVNEMLLAFKKKPVLMMLKNFTPALLISFL